MIPLLDDLRTLEADLRTKADDYLRSSKAYTCRSNSDVRAGLVKGAAVMRINADRIGAIIAKHSEPTYEQGVAEVTERTQAQSRDVATEAEPADQDTRPVDVSDMQEGDGHR